MPVRVPTTTDKDEAAKRRAIYDDVEGMLVPGFLSQPVSVSGVTLAMKTLFPGEMFLLRNRIGFQMTDRAWREWAVATSVWMIDGQVLLGDVNAPVKVREALKGLPKHALDMLFSVFTSLHNRVQRALTRVEAYCYEDFGRAQWRMVGRESPASDGVAGVPGIAAYGMNHVQRLWTAYNLAEDDRQAWNLEWAASKLVASASSPKGVRKLNQKDDAERNLEEERRKGVIGRTYYEASGRRVGEESGMVVYRAVSPEELTDEMNRWARGERDLHDQVIESYKARIREKHEQDRAAHEARMRAVAALQEEAEAVGATPLVGYTLEQLRALRGDAATSRRRGSSVATASSASRLYDKYVSKDIVAGGLSDHGKGVAFPAEPGGSLDDALANRHVRLTDDGGRG
jgi:uncharacterized protein YbjQ (UPF0145 family)